MNKHQVFISSTYEDLKSERDEVIKATLEMGHIPIGMEMFSASDEQQWEVIKKQIDQSDYFVLIAAHKYGSEKDGVSYTEMEYDYALANGLPIICLIIAESASWPNDKYEKDNLKKKKLFKFKEKIREKTVKFWKSKDDISGKFSISLLNQIQAFPRPGLERDTFRFGQGKTSEFWKILFGDYVLNEKIYVIFSAKDKGYDFIKGKPDRDQVGHTIKLSYNEVFAYINLQKELFPIRDNIEVIHGGVDYEIEIEGRRERIVENPPPYEPNGKLIIIGSPHANIICDETLKKLKPKLPYRFEVNVDNEPHYKYIMAGKESYPDNYEESERLDKDYGIILRIGNPYQGVGNNKILVLGGNHGHGTQAAIQTLSDHNRLNSIHETVGENDFEVLFEARTYGMREPNFFPRRISVLKKGRWHEIFKDKG